MILFAVQLGLVLIFAGIVVAGAGHYTYATILRITISDLLDQVSKRKEMSVTREQFEKQSINRQRWTLIGLSLVILGMTFLGMGLVFDLSP